MKCKFRNLASFLAAMLIGCGMAMTVFASGTQTEAALDKITDEKDVSIICSM